MLPRGVLEERFRIAQRRVGPAPCQSFEAHLLPVRETDDGLEDRVEMFAAKNGVDGLKLDSYQPEIMAALIDEAKKQGLGTMAHLSQGGVADMNAVDAARLGVTFIEHHYGYAESALPRSTQNYPRNYNFNDENHRFREAGDAAIALCSGTIDAMPKLATGRATLQA